MTSTPFEPEYFRHPYKILLEGINNCGKDYVADKLIAEYGDLIHYIKFPNNERIIEQIKFLYNMTMTSKLEDIPTILKITHDLFELDFHLNDPWVGSNQKPIWLVNRYWPSNVVYSKIHGVFDYYYERGHDMDPFDICMWLEVGRNQQELYVRTFPGHFSTIPTSRQRITPNVLFSDGQEFYYDCLKQAMLSNNFKSFQIIPALKENTYDMVKDYFVSMGILPKK